MINMNDEFTKWLLKELDQRDWSQAKLARLGGFSRSSLSRILNGQRKIGVDVASKIADALSLPPEVVFQKAGLLKIKEPGNEQLQELVTLYEQLSDIAQHEVLLIVRHRHDLHRQALKQEGY
jgi:transcriptional regulator with XRE-family HTH domain